MHGGYLCLSLSISDTCAMVNVSQVGSSGCRVVKQLSASWWWCGGYPYRVQNRVQNRVQLMSCVGRGLAGCLTAETCAPTKTQAVGTLVNFGMQIGESQTRTWNAPQCTKHFRRFTTPLVC
ncbi:hypothetical protein N658DRAFT_210979 [Parathielavia hyrcaniae]|uniref:Uncharacterized protein n=1 Tax=Parathielavia hyrcaniae TaxID=113614 RepID=A0AAN6PY63_9PEZI|nr:hypothetical protein N658DRAFT_210979 [Parathielavia hyrcaniae]